MRMQLRFVLSLSITFTSFCNAESYDPQMVDYLNNQLNYIQSQGPTQNSGSGLTAAQLESLNQSGLGLPGTELGKNFYGNTANGLSAGVLNGNLQDASGVNYDLDNNAKGREIKAQNSKESAAKGNGAAIAAGATLTSIGGAMLARGIATLNAPLIAAGSDLLAKGALEFAQAGEDAGAAGANGAQEALLMSDNPKGPQFVTDQANAARNASANEAKSRINTPEMQSLLGNQGINSDDFLDRLARGGFSSAEEIANGLGLKNEISAEDRLQGQMLAGQALSGMKELSFDESKNDLNGNGLATNSISGAGAAASATGSSPGDKPALAANGEAAGANAGGVQSGSAKKDGEPGAQGSGFGPEWAKGLLGHGAAAAAPGTKLLATLTPAQLQAVGLAQLVKGQNLFQRVHRTYRRFGDWRKENGRLARN